MYLFGRFEAEAEAEREAQEIAGVGLGVPLLLIGATLALRQLQSPVILLAGWVGSGDNYKLLFF